MATYTLKMPKGKYPGQYIPTHWATDYNPALNELLAYGNYTSQSATKAVYRMDNGVTLVITGTNLTYVKPGSVISGGTITSLQFLDTAGGSVVQTVTGLKLAGSEFRAAVNVGSTVHTAKVILRGADTLHGTDGKDELWSYGGNDKLFGGAGADNLMGGRGADTYDGGTSAGSIDQLDFEDAYNDANGAKGVTVDMAKGTAIDPWGYKETFINIERIKGTQFVDKMYGSARADEFRPLGGNDIVDGRGGIDTIRYDRDAQHYGSKGVSVDLNAGVGTDGFGNKDKLSNIENVVGTEKGDTLKGNSAANELTGSGGNDKLYGGLGKDVLIGGTGQDTFVFNTKPTSSNIDTIKDFNVKDDTIWLDDDVFTKIGKVGDLAPAAFYIGAKAHDASDRIIYDKTTGKLFYDADGTGSTAAVQFATLTKGLAMTATDFDIIA
ncbi:Ca2+-binding RTX toxin-like protein [Mycoplana sp. BE70]|uniref:calcium-binding protein n=1 Tax=Mycoplana sp. BE70 TaxID=2817775 RepID=UPI00285D6057|nr:calcium-binding protein [Mycoplana sp. BE70]MDR6757419.1 Ca2+-binding RTX toxin-like protein [Mycoplana sp. BE70]